MRRDEQVGLLTMENEAPVVAFTNYKRTDNFEISITFRGNDIADVMSKLNQAIEGIKKNGGTPISRNKGGFPAKPEPKYLEGKKCPLDGGRLVEPQPGSKTPIKCENNRWNFQLKKAEGCPYIEWPSPEGTY